MRTVGGKLCAEERHEEGARAGRCQCRALIAHCPVLSVSKSSTELACSIPLPRSIASKPMSQAASTVRFEEQSTTHTIHIMKKDVHDIDLAFASGSVSHNA